VDGGEDQVRERAADEAGVHRAEREAEQPPCMADGGEDGRVEEREEQAVCEVERPADRAGAVAVLGERRPGAKPALRVSADHRGCLRA
jgi:hypothetical protein